MKNKPEPDAPKFAHGELVRRTIAPALVGQVSAIIFLPGCIGYRVQWPDSVDEHYQFELEAAPSDWSAEVAQED